MAHFYKSCLFWLLVIAVSVDGYSQRPGLTLECIGNVMKLTMDSSLTLGRQLEIEVINGSRIVTLTQSLAVQCGYSVDSDPWGNMRVYTSLLSCFTHNHADAVFDIGLRLQLYGNEMSDDVLEVEKTCEYNQWASREILCERNFMEVSVQRGRYNMNLPKQPKQEGISGFFSNQQTSITLDNIWKMVFYTPEEKPMMLEEVQDAGYGVSVTPTRLVVRSPYNTPETYIEEMDGVQMEVFKVSTYFKRVWSVMIIESAAACPTGGLQFTDELITWHMPRYITPLTIIPQHQILAVHMGINGKRLSQAEMRARGYTMTISELQILISLPVGGPDGYYKSNVFEYEYHVTYSIEPMFEMLWLEGTSEITRYRVHYPIMTPAKPRPLFITDNTLSSSDVFSITLGSFLPDVVLLNITFSTGVVSIEEANGKGFNVQEHLFSDSSKVFSIEVPFSDPAVLRTKPLDRHVLTASDSQECSNSMSINPMNVVYSLPLTFGLLVLPEFTPFSHSALVEASRKDIRSFTMNGVCDDKNFYITIAPGSQGVNFNMKVGTRDLTADLYTEYGVTENANHRSMTIPFLAQDVVFEKVEQSSLRARVDVTISYNKKQMKHFSLACSFPLILTECFANGSITALAVKVDAATQMIPSQLTLRDPSCKPVFSNNRFAFFSFTANSCQTTRMFSNGVMTYRNRILMENRTAAGRDSPDYSVFCDYMLTKTLALEFFTGPQPSQLRADPGFGELHVRMRLARDASYNAFYMDNEYPVVRYLKQPLYFEVELMQSNDPQIELVLENCWVTASHIGSTMSWDLIVNGCANPADHYQITFYPVVPDARVLYPSHVRRFKIDMFTFVKDDMPLRDQIVVHCDTVLCDVLQADDVCNIQCPLSKTESIKRGRRTGHEQHRIWVSSGKIVLPGL